MFFRIFTCLNIFHLFAYLRTCGRRRVSVSLSQSYLIIRFRTTGTGCVVTVVSVASFLKTFALELLLHEINIFINSVAQRGFIKYW